MLPSTSRIAIERHQSRQYRQAARHDPVTARPNNGTTASMATKESSA